MQNLTGFQRDLLVLVAGMDSPKGLAINEELDEYYGSEINHGRLYPNLDELDNQGLIEKGQIDDRTNSYSITQDGLEMLNERLEWEDKYVDL